MEKYAAAKRRLFAGQQEGDIAVLSADDPLLAPSLPGKAGTLLRFGMQPGSDALVTDDGVRLSVSLPGGRVEEYYPLSGTALASLVNRLNAAAAILAVRAFGCLRQEIQPGLADYRPPAHRMALVGEIGGVRYVDDSKGTNIGAVAAALASSGNRIILIAGGRDKGSDFSLLAPAVRKHVKHLVLLGEAAGQMHEALGGLVPTSRVGTMEEAVRVAAESADPGDTVLLSPGCASFDMFTSYAQRGDVFRQAVLGLSSLQQENV